METERKNAPAGGWPQGELHMKRTLLALAGMLLMGLGMASAQIVTPMTFTIHSPFYVGNALLPAGSYDVLPTTQTGLLVFRSAEEHASAFALVGEKGNRTLPKSSEVRFEKYGDVLVLRAVVAEGQWDAAVTSESRVEKRAREANGPAADVVVPANKAVSGRS